MKKLMAVLLSMVLVFGFGTMAMANGHGAPEVFGDAELEVGINIAPYAEFGIVTDFYSNSDNKIKGLFSGVDITMPGLYVSDGNATEVAAISHFGLGGNFASINTVDTDNVEMIVVAANTDTVLTMESDFGLFANNQNAQLMFRFSSNDNIGDVHDGSFLPANTFEAGDFYVYSDLDNYNLVRWAGEPYVNMNTLITRGTLTNNTMAILDTATGLTGSSWNGWGEDQIISSLDSNKIAYIDIPFRQCTPSLVHVNGALLLEKATAIEAGDYFTTIDFTLTAAQ